MKYIQEERCRDSFQMRKLMGKEVDIYENIDSIKKNYIVKDIRYIKKIKGMNGITYSANLGGTGNKYEIYGVLIAITTKRKRQIHKLTKESVCTMRMKV